MAAHWASRILRDHINERYGLQVTSTQIIEQTRQVRCDYQAKGFYPGQIPLNGHPTLLVGSLPRIDSRLNWQSVIPPISRTVRGPEASTTPSPASDYSSDDQYSVKKPGKGKAIGHKKRTSYGTLIKEKQSQLLPPQSTATSSGSLPQRPPREVENRLVAPTLDDSQKIAIRLQIKEETDEDDRLKGVLKRQVERVDSMDRHRDDFESQHREYSGQLQNLAKVRSLDLSEDWVKGPIAVPEMDEIESDGEEGRRSASGEDLLEMNAHKCFFVDALVVNLPSWVYASFSPSSSEPFPGEETPKRKRTDSSPMSPLPDASPIPPQKKNKPSESTQAPAARPFSPLPTGPLAESSSSATRRSAERLVELDSSLLGAGTSEGLVDDEFMRSPRDTVEVKQEIISMALRSESGQFLVGIKRSEIHLDSGDMAGTSAVGGEGGVDLQERINNDTSGEPARLSLED